MDPGECNPPIGGISAAKDMSNLLLENIKHNDIIVGTLSYFV